MIRGVSDGAEGQNSIFLQNTKLNFDCFPYALNFLVSLRFFPAEPIWKVEAKKRVPLSDLQQTFEHKAKIHNPSEGTAPSSSGLYSPAAGGKSELGVILQLHAYLYYTLFMARRQCKGIDWEGCVM